MTPLAITHYTATSCLGAGLDATFEALCAARGGLNQCEFDTADLDTYVGVVPELDRQRLPAELARYDCRNNRLAQLGLSQDGFMTAVAAALRRRGPRRVGVFLGTSTSGILETEMAYRRRDPTTGELPSRLDYAGTHNTYSVAAFVRARLAIAGPAVVVSTACSSSAKVFGAAQRMIEAGVIDAAVVGGVDSLCLTTLYGFHSLQLVSRLPCRPFDAARDGLSLGEAAAFALLERPGADCPPARLRLLGVGESNDAYHLSAPHPDGLGARLAIQGALKAAHVEPDDVDYINLHGTATPSNDVAESAAVCAAFERPPPSSSTKGATGHALGAAGALEAVICGLALERQFLPAGLNVTRLDPACALPYVLENRPARIRYVLSNSFGFGGTNCSLLLGSAA
jgi:3-oxoacyl-[acyl-carrier-protein] synthase I